MPARSLINQLATNTASRHRQVGLAMPSGIHGVTRRYVRRSRTANPAFGASIISPETDQQERMTRISGKADPYTGPDARVVQAPIISSIHRRPSAAVPCPFIVDRAWNAPSAFLVTTETARLSASRLRNPTSISRSGFAVGQTRTSTLSWRPPCLERSLSNCAHRRRPFRLRRSRASCRRLGAGPAAH